MRARSPNIGEAEPPTISYKSCQSLVRVSSQVSVVHHWKINNSTDSTVIFYDLKALKLLGFKHSLEVLTQVSNIFLISRHLQFTFKLFFHPDRSAQQNE